MNKFRLYGTFCVGIFAFISSSAKAVIVEVDFSSLPSTQGWVYDNEMVGADPEGNIFTVSNGVLTQDSMGIGLVTGAAPRYLMENMIDPNLPFTLEWTARVLADEGFINYGSNAAITVDNQAINIGLGTNLITLSPPRGQPIFNDNTEFHDFRIEGQFGVGGSAQLFIDNVFAADVPIVATSSPYNRLGWGDGSGSANALAQYTAYKFTQVVPIPAAIWLFGSGLLGLVGIARRKESV